MTTHWGLLGNAVQRDEAVTGSKACGEKQRTMINYVYKLFVFELHEMMP